MNNQGQRLYFAEEKSNCFIRHLCGPSRPFTMTIYDNVGCDVITLHKALRWSCCWSNCCLQKVSKYYFYNVIQTLVYSESLSNSIPLDHWLSGVSTAWPQSTFAVLSTITLLHGDFLGSSVGKESACNAGDSGLIPGSGRSPGEEKGYPLQYSGLENSMGLQRVGHD